MRFGNIKFISESRLLKGLYFFLVLCIWGCEQGIGEKSIGVSESEILDSISIDLLAVTTGFLNDSLITPEGGLYSVPSDLVRHNSRRPMYPYEGEVRRFEVFIILEGVINCDAQDSTPYLFSRGPSFSRKYCRSSTTPDYYYSIAQFPALFKGNAEYEYGTGFLLSFIPQIEMGIGRLVIYIFR